MYGSVKVWQEIISLPTWTTGAEDPNPMFLEKRVYQGSSGSVYPYGVIDTLTGEREMRDYQAVWMENDFLRVMLLPELGGRIHRAYDKVKQRDFVYYNEVVKPALVGLLGPGSPAESNLTGRNITGRRPLSRSIFLFSREKTARRPYGWGKRSPCAVCRLWPGLRSILTAR
ncbi:putative transferase [Klebsiella pneumoniae]|nr:putative transferase [Klebsiella pneumoniae]SWU83155.1 putative transferase [Klebsiella pneumoniae]